MSEDLGKKEQEIYERNLEKAAEWRKAGFHPWGNGYRPGHLAGELTARFAQATAADLESNPPGPFDVAGRVVELRAFGKMAFIKLRDRSGQIQAQLKKDLLGEAYEVFKLVDRGDFAAVSGKLIRTKTGELTVVAEKFTPLTKALRPLPEKWHGLQDVELRYRQRYLDLVANPDVRQIFLKRTQLIRSIRDFLDRRDFVEVETPMMHPLVSGAAARVCVSVAAGAGQEATSRP